MIFDIPNGFELAKTISAPSSFRNSASFRNLAYHKNTINERILESKKCSIFLLRDISIPQMILDIIFRNVFCAL